MARDCSSIFNLHTICYFLFPFSFISYLSFLTWSHSNSCNNHPQTPTIITQQPNNQTPPLWSGHLLSLSSSWNHLSFTPNPPAKLLRIALFVKKWPRRNLSGGLERHALTLHLALAKRGHTVHVFTPSLDSNLSLKLSQPNIHFHFSEPSPAGLLNQAVAWQQFETQNSTQSFDVVHTESVGLSHFRARNLTHLAVSWHGIAYETIHSDIVQDLVRRNTEARSLDLQKALTERILKVVEEVKFFQDYAHHVATSDHVGDVLKRIYMIPEERVHVILNGVDEKIFRPDLERGRLFRRKFGVPESGALVLGMAGRLVKDKGHPIMFEALKQVLMEENQNFEQRVFVLVAGDGPWDGRYRDLGPNLLVLGPLEQAQLAGFYNSLDIFVNPTLRAQGLDHTLLEAMLSGKPVMATRFASITESVIVNSELGYTFSPIVGSLKAALYRVLEDGIQILEKKGEAARLRASKLFTATKMASAYERLFLCISSINHRVENINYCKYPLSEDEGGN